jgi:HEAT repeat protein
MSQDRLPTGRHLPIVLLFVATAWALAVGCSPPVKRELGVVKAHPDWRQRMQAANRLGVWGKSTEDVEALIEAMRSDEELFVRNAAAHSLGRIKDPRAIEPLITAMLQDIAVREEAVKSLAAIGGPTVEARIRSLSRSEDSLAREYAMGALALLNDDGHLTTFIEESMADPSPSVRRQAVEALRATTSKKGKPAPDPLVRFLGSPEERIRLHVAEDMGLTQQPVYVPLLIEAATGDSSDGVRRKACVALGRIGTDDATDALVRLLDDPRAPPEAVLRGLVSTRQSVAVEPIIERYDRDGFPRRAAVEALSELGGPKVLAFFQERLADERGAVRRAIIDAMAEMRGRAASQALIETFLSDPASQVRVVRVLEKMGGEDVIEFLARAAVDPDVDPSARRAAVQALKNESGETTDAILRQAALSRRPAVARAARQAMEALELSPPLKPPDLEELRRPRFSPPPP